MTAIADGSSLLLLGPRAAGKSTLAPLIAKKIGYSCLDLEHDARLCDTEQNPLLKALLGSEAQKTLRQCVLEAELNAMGVVLTLSTELLALCAPELLGKLRVLVLAPDPQELAGRPGASGQMLPSEEVLLPAGVRGSQCRVPIGEEVAVTLERILKWWTTGEI